MRDLHISRYDLNRVLNCRGIISCSRSDNLSISMILHKKILSTRRGIFGIDCAVLLTYATSSPITIQYYTCLFWEERLQMNILLSTSEIEEDRIWLLGSGDISWLGKN